MINWQATLSGAALGAAIGVVAYLLDGSPWWWLAVPIAAILGASLRVRVSAQWSRK